MKIRLYNAVGRMKVYFNETQIPVSADVENFLRLYMSEKYGMEAFIYVGQEATIDVPDGLEIKDNEILIINP